VVPEKEHRSVDLAQAFYTAKLKKKMFISAEEDIFSL